METNETRGRPAKSDNASIRRGINIRFARELLDRVDQARNSTPRTAWIRNAIEDKLKHDPAPHDRT